MRDVFVLASVTLVNLWAGAALYIDGGWRRVATAAVLVAVVVALLAAARVRDDA